MLIGAVTDGRDAAITWHEVSSKTRLVRLLAGDIDMECGSTSNTDRRRRVGLAFSTAYFVSDVAVLLPAALAASAGTMSAWFEYMRANRLRVVTTNGSTSMSHLRQMGEESGRHIEVIAGADHEDSFNKLASGEARAFAMDRALLAARLASDERFRGGKYVLSVWSLVPKGRECYAIAMRSSDRDLQASVNRALEFMKQSGELRRLYDRWFVQPLGRDDGLSDMGRAQGLGMPISSELEVHFAGIPGGPCT